MPPCPLCNEDTYVRDGFPVGTCWYCPPCECHFDLDDLDEPVRAEVEEVVA